MTFLGGSYLNLAGFTSPYPGHLLPDREHLLHAGCVKSHTTRRRRHSQQWRLRSLSILGAVHEEFKPWFVGMPGTDFAYKHAFDGEDCC